MIDVDVSDVGVKLDALAKQAGETTEQATIRFGVAVGKGLAAVMGPGATKVAALKRKTSAQVRKVVEPVHPTYFRKLSSGKYHRIKLDKEWIEVSQDKLLSSASDVVRRVDRHRDNRGKTRDLPRRERFFCRRADFNKAVRERVKRWGVAKGGWLGGAVQLSRLQRGMSRNTVGKNFQRIGQKHLWAGSGRKLGRDHRTTAFLYSQADAARYSDGMPRSGVNRAMRTAQKGLFKYYGAEIRRRERKIK